VTVRPAVALLLLLALPAPAQFVDPEGGHYHNGSTLPLEDDGRAGVLLQKLQAAADRLDTDESLSLLDALRALPAATLVPLGSRVHLPAMERAARLVVEPGHESLADAVLVGERAAIAEAARALDLPALISRATRGTALPSADEAALAAARLLFEEGRFGDAEALAGRAHRLPGAAELAAAARRRLGEPPAGPPPDLGARGWVAQNAGSVPASETSDGGLPFVASAGNDRLLLLANQGVFLLDRATRAALRGLDPVAGLQAHRSEALYPPAPQRHVAARDGARWVLACNPLERPAPDLFEKDTTIGRRAGLVALDLDDALRPAWAAMPPAGDELSSACGPPLLWSGRVYCQVFRMDVQTSVSLACFDLADGRLLWETPLASAQQVRRFSTRFAPTSVEGQDKRAVDVAPAVRDGVVWCCTGYGVLAAVDGLTGTPLFTFRYDRLFAQDPDTYEPAFLYETGGWDAEPLRFWPGRVVVAPPDSRFLYMLAERPGPLGQLVLDDPIEKLDRLHVVSLRADPGGRPSPALLCTRRSAGRGGLVLLGPDGHALEASPLLPADAEVTGRPLPIGDRVLLPTAAGLLELSQSDLSAPPRPVPWPRGSPAAVAAAYPLEQGLASISPVLGGDPPRPVWLLQWYTAAE